MEAAGLGVINQRTVLVGRQHGFNPDGLVRINRCCEPLFDSVQRIAVCSEQIETFALSDSRSQRIWVNDPDRTPEALDLRLVVERTLTRPIRAGYDPQRRPVNASLMHSLSSHAARGGLS